MTLFTIWPNVVVGMPVQPFVQLWIWISAFATIAGWTLSVFGQLNRTGYTLAIAVFVVFLFIKRKRCALAYPWKFEAKKLIHHFHRPLPLSFAVVAVLVFLGGSLYPPDNYTAITYRFPRILQWLAHGSWFWIHTTNYRMNDRACGIEWLSAPLLLFTKSTRLLFLLNFLPFLLMPGLTFSVLIRMGVRSRVAWQWMWLLPTGYIFLLQAASAANDFFPTVYGLAAMDFAFRWRESKNWSDLSNSILSAALLTGAKAGNLPLLLPWAILMAAGAWQTARQNALLKLVGRLIPVILVSAVVSFLPTAILNFVYCGDWTGAVLEEPRMLVDNPFIGVAGNAFQFLLQNLCPPFFPQAGWWNAHAPGFFPAALVSISKHFIPGFFQVGEMPTEDAAGLGLGLSVLLAFSVAAKFFSRRPGESSLKSQSGDGKVLRFCIVIAPWIALLVYSAKSGMTTAARLIAPYYPLLLPLLLAGMASSQLVRRRAWHILVFGNWVVAIAVLISTPARPLWPAQTILTRLVARHPHSHGLSRARDVYSVYASRPDPLASVRGLLPQGVRVVGFAGGTDDSEISFWLPFGSRRVKDFLVTDSPVEIRKRGIEYAIITSMQLPQKGLTVDDWLKKSGAELLAITHATLKIETGEQTFYLVRFKS